MTKCQCSGQGWCPAHKRLMSQVDASECKSDDSYYRMFQNLPPVDSSGLGTIISQVTQKTGVKMLINAVAKATGKDCGCHKRAVKLNQWWSYQGTKQPEINGNWCVTVTTAPRPIVTLQQTLASVIENGWHPTIFAEPGSDLTGCDDLNVIQNEKRLGAWHNWVQSMRYAYETGAEYILSMQDDTVFALPDTRRYLESLSWPHKNCGMLSLYTPSHYQHIAPKGSDRKALPSDLKRDVSLHRVDTTSLHGLCAVVFRREGLKQLLKHQYFTKNSWKGARSKNGTFPDRKPHEIANVDTAVGNMINSKNMTMWFFTPSLTQHIATTSSIGHGGNGWFRSASEVVKNWSVFDGNDTPVFIWTRADYPQDYPHTDQRARLLKNGLAQCMTQQTDKRFTWLIVTKNQWVKDAVAEIPQAKCVTELSFTGEGNAILCRIDDDDLVAPSYIETLRNVGEIDCVIDFQGWRQNMQTGEFVEFDYYGSDKKHAASPFACYSGSQSRMLEFTETSHGKLGEKFRIARRPERLWVQRIHAENKLMRWFKGYPKATKPEWVT